MRPHRTEDELAFYALVACCCALAVMVTMLTAALTYIVATVPKVLP